MKRETAAQRKERFARTIAARSQSLVPTPEAVMQAAQMMTSSKTVRLSCMECFGADHDGISEVELSALIAAGWRNVEQVQTLEQSLTVYDADEAPANYSVFDWETHRGVCPECVACT